MTAEILLGTVAIEPNRWAMVDDSWCATVQLSEWLDRIAVAGFDGIEVWEKHLTEADDAETERIVDHPLPIPVVNSYVSLDTAEPDERAAVARWAQRSGSRGVKFNVGNDASQQQAYAERIARWLQILPPEVVLLCECHHGISIAEDPTMAAAIFDAAGPSDRVQAIVHTHEDPDHVRARFDAYGDRIGHVHVNFLDFENGGLAPPLSDIRPRLESQVTLLRGLGFDGSWTLEFTHGLLTENDNPDYLLSQAAEDLEVLREVLA